MTNSDITDFDSDFYMATLRTARNCGLPVMSMSLCAQLMAILLVWGNNEGFTLSPKFKCDCEYIQETYHVNGGEVYDKDFATELQKWAGQYEAGIGFVEASELIMKRYNFKLYK